MIIRPRWRKVLRDLWGNKIRSLLAVLSIAAGVFAIGVIIDSQAILSRELRTAFAAINPASATLTTSQPFDEELVETVRHIDSVKEAEGRYRVNLRLKAGDERWVTLDLSAISDFDDIASYLPAQRAVRLTVREVLAYE